MNFVKRWVAPVVVAMVIAASTWVGLNLVRIAYYDHQAVQQIIQLINQNSKPGPTPQAAPDPK